jgi:hypothetical protein
MWLKNPPQDKVHRFKICCKYSFFEQEISFRPYLVMLQCIIEKFFN